MPPRATATACPLEEPGRWRAAAGSAPGLPHLLARGEWHLLQRQSGRTAYRVETPRGPFFVKHYAPRGPLRCLSDLGLRSKPGWAFRRGLRLQGAGVATPAPLGAFRLPGGPARQALLVTAWLGATRPWVEHLRSLAEVPEGGAALAAALADGARLLGRLHRCGYYHGDLVSNLLCAGEGRAGRAQLVDLEGLRRPLSRARRVKNLEELGRALPDLELVSLRRRWCFLRDYAAAAGLAAGETRRLWREGRSAQRVRLARAARGAE